MDNRIIIVESPEKARLIFGMLKKQYKVFATRGHIRDLPEKEYGVNHDENGFEGKMSFKPHAKEVLNQIKAALTPDADVYIATDDDYEGERIAHDVVLALKLTNYKRIAFSEISKEAVEKAIKNPREIDFSKLNAQKARRLIDRITGYPGSHAIKKDFQKLGLPYEPHGIGRSIAPALKLLCEVEEAKRDFEENPPDVEKMIRAKFNIDGIEFVGKLPGTFPEGMELEMTEMMNLFSRNKARVAKVKPAQTQKSPPKPLTTSSYQYGMFYLFGIKPKRAMELAQALYNAGFITYPRTDSCRVSEDKAIAFMDVVLEQFGEEYCNDITRLHQKEDDKGAQNAHPALLPTKVIPTHRPDRIFDFWANTGRFCSGYTNSF